MQKLVECLIKLETDGISINGKQLYFVLELVVGDNLGINTLLGLAKGFRATHFCSIRKLSLISNTTTVCTENVSDLRNIQNYMSDLYMFFFMKIAF